MEFSKIMEQINTITVIRIAFNTLVTLTGRGGLEGAQGRARNKTKIGRPTEKRERPETKVRTKHKAGPETEQQTQAGQHKTEPSGKGRGKDRTGRAGKGGPEQNKYRSKVQYKRAKPESNTEDRSRKQAVEQEGPKQAEQ